MSFHLLTRRISPIAFNIFMAEGWKMKWLKAETMKCLYHEAGVSQWGGASIRSGSLLWIFRRPGRFCFFWALAPRRGIDRQPCFLPRLVNPKELSLFHLCQHSFLKAISYSMLPSLFSRSARPDKGWCWPGTHCSNRLYSTMCRCWYLPGKIGFTKLL